MNFNLVSPETTDDLLHVIDEHHGKRFRFGAGYTDLVMELGKQDDRELTVINLARLSDPRFTSIEEHADGGMRIGALVTAGRIVSHKALNERYPVLGLAAGKLASRQIRHVATVGGNLCTASPAGDIGCALVALGALCEALSPAGGTRTIPIDDFFVATRETSLKSNEVLRGVIIPPVDGKCRTYFDFVKIGTRRSMEIATVSIAYHIEADEDDTITRAGIAIGSAAPTIRYVRSACEYLVGRKFSAMGRSESEAFAAKVLEYASPISDLRASAWYRREVLFNLGKSIFGR